MKDYIQKNYIQKAGQVDSHQLPPWKDILQQHTHHANYQTGIGCEIFKIHQIYQRLLNDMQRKRTAKEKGKLYIKWMAGVPAPEAVLAIMGCSGFRKLC